MPIVDIPNVGQVQFPDDMSPDQITQAIERDILKTSTPAPQPKTSAVSSFFRGAGDMGSFGFGDELIGGVAAPVLKAVRPDLFGDQSLGQVYKDTRDTVRQQNAKAFQDHPIANLVGGLAGGLWAPGQANNLKQAAGIGALTTGAYGFGSSEADTLGGRAWDALPFVAAGAAVPVAAAPIMKGINAIKGGAIDPAAQFIIDQGKKYGVRLGAADVSSNPALKGIDQGLEEIPMIGTRGFRAGQNEEAKVAAQGLASQAQNQMLNKQFENADQLRQIAQSGGIRAKQAQQLLDDIANSGDDWQKIVDTSGNLKLFNNKLAADQKYKLVEDLASKYGAVGLQNTSQALQGAMQRAGESVLPDKQLTGLLSTLNTNLGKGNLTYSQLRQARSDIGSLISDAYKGQNAAVGTQGTAALQSIKDAITRDMDSFAQANGPELSKAWRDADSYYRAAVAPYKDVQLAKALSGGVPDEIYSKFITSGGIEEGKGTTRALKLYNALDPKGQAAVRYGMVQNALSKASSPDTGAFSPAKFASELDNIAAAKGVFFKGAAKAEIDGFKNLMRHVERSNVAINKPETGVKNIPYIIGAAAGAGAYFDPQSTTAVVLSTYGLKKLMTTPAGRNFLLSSSKLKAGSPQMQKALDRFIQSAQLTAVAGGSKAMNGGFDNTNNLYGTQP